MAAPGRIYFRDAIGRFASRGHGRLGKAAGNIGKGVGQRFVGGVMDAGIAEANRRRLNAVVGRSYNITTGSRKFNRYGRARNRVVNRYNAARYSPGGQRFVRHARATRAGAYQAGAGVHSSRVGRAVRAVHNDRVLRAIHRTNVRHNTFPYATGVPVQYAKYYRGPSRARPAGPRKGRSHSTIRTLLQASRRRR